MSAKEKEEALAAEKEAREAEMKNKSAIYEELLMEKEKTVQSAEVLEYLALFISFGRICAKPSMSQIPRSRQKTT